MPGERDQHRSQRPVAKLPGPSVFGLIALAIWVLIGAFFSIAFITFGALGRSVLLLFILVWALIGPFALSIFFVELGSILIRGGHYQAALVAARMGTYVDRAVLPMMNLFGMYDSPLAVLNLANEANAMICLCQFQQAADILEVALDKAQATNGWDHILTQAIVGQVAGAYVCLGRFDEAEQYFRRAIASKSAQIKPLGSADDPEAQTMIAALAMDRFGLACLMEKKHRFEQAEGQYKEAIDAIEKNVFEDTDFLANHLNGLGELYAKTGRMSEAEEPINRALEIRKEIFAPGHLVLSSSYHTLGYLRMKQGNLVDAERHLNDALKIRTRIFGENHQNLADTFKALGELEMEKGNLPKSEEYFSKALNILEKVFGKSYPDIVPVLEAQASLFVRTGQQDKATESHRQAQAIRASIK